MSYVLSRTGVLAAALASFVLVDGPGRAEDKRGQELNLMSRYAGNVLVDGARRVSLSVTLDGKGGGSGTLTFDPNIYEGETATCIAVKYFKVRVEAVADAENETKGRRVYELKQTGPEGKVETGDERWFLVRPIKGGADCWLVFADKDGKFRDILMLEELFRKDARPRP
ncbi:MAG TPA: hypothetical protein VKD71_15095 [Gemmataceae bacterium]|nr:hypothetical protein [Gemmataceae bacterium]